MAAVFPYPAKIDIYNGIKFESEDFPTSEVGALKGIILTYIASHPVCLNQVQELLQHGPFTVIFKKNKKHALPRHRHLNNMEVFINQMDHDTVFDMPPYNMIEAFVLELVKINNPMYKIFTHKINVIYENKRNKFACFKEFFPSREKYATEYFEALYAANIEAAAILSFKVESLAWTESQTGQTYKAIILNKDEWDNLRIPLVELQGQSQFDQQMIAYYKLGSFCLKQDLSQFAEPTYQKEESETAKNSENEARLLNDLRKEEAGFQREFKLFRSLLGWNFLGLPSRNDIQLKFLKPELDPVSYSSAAATKEALADEDSGKEKHNSRSKTPINKWGPLSEWKSINPQKPQPHTFEKPSEIGDTTRQEKPPSLRRHFSKPQSEEQPYINEFLLSSSAILAATAVIIGGLLYANGSKGPRPSPK